MRSLMILSLIILAQVFLVSCATTDRSDCNLAMWDEVGFKDGASGSSGAKISEHQSLCGGGLSLRQQSLYEEGRVKGLVQYCSAKGAYQAGAEGRVFQPVCEKASEPELLKHHSAGRKVFLKKQELSHVREEIEVRRRAHGEDKSVVGDLSRAYHLFSGTSPTESLDQRDEDLSDEIYRLESEAPPGYVNSDIGQNSALSTGVLLPFMGAAFGTAGGFGMGHAIQGRYDEQGWKWTVIDTSIIATLAIAAHNCPNQGLSTTGSVETTAMSGSSCDFVLPIGVLTFVGSRVWQSVDLWSYARKSLSPLRAATERSSLNVLVVPNSDGVQLSAAWNW